MPRVLSAEKPCRVLSSFCRVVKSYGSGGAWVISFRSTFVTCTVPASVTAANEVFAAFLSPNLSTERAENTVASFAVWSFNWK